ncbi:hypothetical protein LTR08_006003 [Meristemomyces frigidus]|nr:hypothetical protein LTR08_006003 [Meristemomyces frigidus]
MAPPGSGSASRPKRAAEEYARSHDNTTKKPRFDHRNPSTLAADAPEEDLILDADVIGKSGAQTKRNAVNIDGYDSDSDNDNFNARAADRERRKKDDGGGTEKISLDEEEDDMFADVEEGMQGTADGDEDEEVGREGKKGKKDVRFLEPADIEGQVMNSRSGGHVAADLLVDQKGKQKEKDVESSSESGSDEERDLLPDEMEEELAAEIGAGGKKRHAPKLDAFNLRAEEEDGRYDESGNFVRKATDPDAANDSWLEGLSKRDMKRAREAQEKRDEERVRKATADDATLTSDLLSALIDQLDTGESPLEALQRLEKSKPKETRVPKWKQKKQRNGMDVDGPVGNANGAAVDPVEAARRKAVEAITAAADALYSREQHVIYETEREKLMRQYKRETGEDWQAGVAARVANGDDGDSGQWEYKWSDARDGGESHGPYDGATIRAWVDAGYFGEGVEYRRIGGQWSRVLDVS